MNSTRRFWLVAACLGALSLSGLAKAETTSWKPNVRWRGFNLVARFWTENAGNWKPWTCFAQDPDEFDFEFMHDFGFNFARVPMDYRLWCKDGNRDEIDDAKVAKLVDPYIAWGKKWGVHVNFCFYFAPGYTIAGYQAQQMGDSDKLDLHSNPETLARCCKHWAYFAKRYKGIPNEQLSFNLMNEPSRAMTEETYAPVARKLIETIHAIDPDRFIISDGIATARRPTMGIVGMPNVGQAFRGYEPGSVTHYHADWNGRGNLGGQPAPVWPLRGLQPSAMLYGPNKGAWQVPLTLEKLPAGKLHLQLQTVSGTVTLRAEADGKTVWREMIEMRPDSPDCVGVVYHTQWCLHRGLYTKPFDFTFEKPVGKFSLVCETGDWAEIGSIAYTDTVGHTTKVELQHAWGFQPKNNGFTFQGWNTEVPLLCNWLASKQDRRYSDAGMQYLYERNQKIIDDFTAGAGKDTFVMIGEFGSHNQGPHPVTLDWMEDHLKLWKERNLGWAMWNLRGSFGVVDSGRADVKYEDYKGHKLDRRMLELLRRY